MARRQAEEILIMRRGAITPPEPPSAARERALRGYVDQLRDWCSGLADDESGERSAEIDFGRRRLSLDPWELQQLKLGTDGSNVISELLYEITALRAKCMVDTERLTEVDSDGVDTLYRLQGELMLDSAVGTELMSETQGRVDLLVQHGELEQARSVAQALHKLRHAVDEVNRSVAQSEAALTPGPNVEAEVETTIEIAAAPVGEPETAGPAPPAVKTSGPMTRAELTELARRATTDELEIEPAELAPESDGLSTRTRLLVASLALLLVVRLVAVELPRLWSEPLEHLSWSDLRHDAVLEVSSRSPSLYVEVDAVAWDSYGATERRDLLDRVSGEAAARGYTGVLLRSADGRSLAQWWSSGRERLPQQPN